MSMKFEIHIVRRLSHTCSGSIRKKKGADKPKTSAPRSARAQFTVNFSNLIPATGWSHLFRDDLDRKRRRQA